MEKNNTNILTYEDAIRTLKHQILNGYTNVYGSPAEDMVDSILTELLAPHTRWALEKVLEDVKQR